MNHWIVKQEPEAYSWSDLVRDRRTAWTGVRNFQARNNLRAMKKGDFVLFYHSGEEKRIVGLASVVKENYPDPTADDPAWVGVDLAAIKPLVKPVALQEIKADAALRDIVLVRNSRLSVSPLDQAQFRRLMELAGTPLAPRD